MFEPPSMSLLSLRDFRASVRALDGGGLTESELIDHISELEQIKSAVAAAQARCTNTFVAVRTAREEREGVPAPERGRGLSSEIALARRESPVRGARSLGLAKALVREMPHTLDALADGEISEWRATLVVRETATLSRADRAQVDSELAGRLGSMGDRRIAAAARAIAYRLDPGSALRRERGANEDRYVSVRPAPDTMTYLTGFLPVAQGIACHVALKKAAASLRAQGDTRTLGQIMADTLVARVTGQEVAAGTPVEIQLVMTDTAMLDGGDEPAFLHEYGPVAAPVARSLVRDAAYAWVRRLFTRPGDGELVAMDSRRRKFDGQLRELIVTRDQFCRNRWCDALVRHADHVVASSQAGATSADNGQGLCERCNYTKELPGWSAARSPGRRHRVTVTTPTGHRHESDAPRLPGRGRARPTP